MNELMSEKTKLSMEICDLMEQNDNAEGDYANVLSQQLSFLRQRRKDIDGKIAVLKATPKTASAVSASSTIMTPISPFHSQPVNWTDSKQPPASTQIVFDNDADEWERKDFPFTRDIKKAMKQYYTNFA